MNKKEDSLNELDKAGWNAFYKSGMKNINIYTGTVGAVREIKEIQKQEEQEQTNQPEL